MAARRLAASGMRLAAARTFSGVEERLDKEELVVGGPVGTGGEDGMGGSAFANGGREAGLHAFPAVAIAEFGLVQNFEEDEIGVRGGIVAGEGAPEIFELLDEGIIGD